MKIFYPRPKNSSVVKTDMDMRNFRIVNIGSPSSAGDAVPLAHIEQLRHSQSTELSNIVETLQTKFDSALATFETDRIQKMIAENSHQKCECDIDRKIDVLYKVFRREINEAIETLKKFAIESFSKPSLIARCNSMDNEWKMVQSSLIATPVDSMTGTSFRFSEGGLYVLDLEVNYEIKVHIIVNGDELKVIDLSRGENDFTAKLPSNSLLDVVFGDGIDENIHATLKIRKL